VSGAPHAVTELLRRRARGGRDDGARLVLAIEGGGMRGAVSAGIAIAIDELGLTDAFDAVYGASAGALNAVWLLSGNPSDGLRPYADPALIRQYIRRSNVIRARPVVDTRHLVEHLYEHELPLHFDAVLADRARFHPLATDVETGRAVDLPTTRCSRTTRRCSAYARRRTPRACRGWSPTQPGSTDHPWMRRRRGPSQSRLTAHPRGGPLGSGQSALANGHGGDAPRESVDSG